MTKKQLTKPIKQVDFNKKIDPIKVKDASELFMFECECENIHFRHAGYIETLMPFVRADKEQSVNKSDFQVMVCTKCRNCYIWYNDQMYDVTKLIDLDAWEKLENDIHKATGPGGNC